MNFFTNGYINCGFQFAVIFNLMMSWCIYITLNEERLTQIDTTKAARETKFHIKLKFISTVAEIVLSFMQTTNVSQGRKNYPQQRQTKNSSPKKNFIKYIYLYSYKVIMRTLS